ncbi:MAG: BACON domain-containing protein, partial [Gemmatimonadales bacterium]
MTTTMATMRRLLTPAVLAGLVFSVATCRLDMLLESSAATEHPSLSVVPTAVRDSASAGVDEVRRVTVEITNGGVAESEGSFDWIAEESYPWIRLTPREGQVPDTLTITLDPEDLDPGTHEGEITVTASGAGIPDSQVTITVTFITQRPGLAVTPQDIEHQTNLNSGVRFSDTLRISNDGTGELTWTAENDRPWLSLGRTSGTGPGTIPVTINTTGLAAGTHHDEIVITAPRATGSPARVDVTVTIFAPGLTVSPGAIRDTVSFGATTAVTHRLRVSNSGSGAMTWSASRRAPWVALSRSGGSAPADVDVTLDPTGLPQGTHRDTIVFTSPEATNDPVNVPVELAVSQSLLTVTPGTISDEAREGDLSKRQHTLTISNGGSGMFAWTATRDQGWIDLTPTAGIAPPSATITATLDPTGLSPGTHEGRITVSLIGGGAGPVTVPVTFTITRGCEVEETLRPDEVESGTLDSGDCGAPHRPGSFAELYRVAVDAGDTLSLRLTASFDAYLVLADPTGAIVLAQNDECPGETGTACIRDFRIAEGGDYLVEVTSAAAGETGPYQLTATRELSPPSPADATQLRLDGSTPIGVGGTATETGVVFQADVNDPNPRDSIRLEVELRPLGIPFANVPTHLSEFLRPEGGNGPTARAPATGLSDDTDYHWQLRACDRTGRCSAWQPF